MASVGQVTRKGSAGLFWFRVSQGCRETTSGVGISQFFQIEPKQNKKAEEGRILSYFLFLRTTLILSLHGSLRYEGASEMGWGGLVGMDEFELGLKTKGTKEGL